MTRSLLAPLLALCFVLEFMALGVRAQSEVQREQADPAINRAIAFLRTNVRDMGVGQAALAVLAMNKADIPNTDPDLQFLLQKILGQYSEAGYQPSERNEKGLYEAGCVCMALANVDPVGFKPQVQATAAFLISRQKPNGSWDYDDRSAGDCSVSQFALLGLWEADGIGVEIPPRVFDSAALWYMSAQFGDGGWNYHPDQANWAQTVSMTAAGVGSLLLCQRLLAQYRKGADSTHPLLTPLVFEGSAPKFKPVTTTQGLNSAINRGMGWLAANYAPGESPRMGQSAPYGMYGMERVGAFSEKGEIRNMSGWYERGFKWFLDSQSTSGQWASGDAAQGLVPKTSWGILYLVRATAKSVRKIDIRKLGAGTLLGGRGLPEDMNNMTVAQGRIVVRPMNGAVEGMLAVLEDPRNSNLDSALAGLLDRFSKEGPDVLRPLRDRFLKLLRDRDPGIRRVACWALGRMSDLELAPDLIRALLDPDEGVSAEARVSLEVLSRKLKGYGPPRGATADEKLAAAKRWRDWFEQVRPPGLEALDDATLLAGAGRAGGAVVNQDEGEEEGSQESKPKAEAAGGKP